MLPRHMVRHAYHADQAGIRFGAGGRIMSPDWAGWIVLHAAIVTLFMAGAAILVVVGLQTVARWLLRRWWGRA